MAIPSRTAPLIHVDSAANDRMDEEWYDYINTLIGAAGFAAYLASPAAIGGTTPAAGSFTTLNATGAITGRAGTGTGITTLPGVLSVITTAVGNVGAGTDTLMSYTLPANSLSANNKGLRITAWGTTAANANSKTLAAQFGSQDILASFELTASGYFTTAISWVLECTIFRSASNVQTGIAKFFPMQGTIVQRPVVYTLALTQTDNAGIIIKCTGAATADNDIVQRGMLVEFVN